MKLVSASVQGLINSFDYSIDINTEGITFIHSTNGAGKSAFLKLIFSILHGDMDAVMNIPFKKLNIGFDDESTLIVENDKGQILTRILAFLAGKDHHFHFVRQQHQCHCIVTGSGISLRISRINSITASDGKYFDILKNCNSYSIKSTVSFEVGEAESSYNIDIILRLDEIGYRTGGIDRD